MTLFNNKTHTVTFPGCKRHCLEHVVVFGKLIWVVEGDWDGTIIYKRTNGGGITGRVVSTSTVTDASGNLCTKIVFRTKSKLSIPGKKNFFKACRNNNTYGLNLDVLPDKTVLKFVFKQKIMVPQNFTIPVGVDSGVFPLFLNSGKYNDSYKELASQFKVSLPRRTQKTSKLICNFSLNTVPVVQDTVAPACTIPNYRLSGVTSDGVAKIFFYVTETLTLNDQSKCDIEGYAESGCLTDGGNLTDVYQINEEGVLSIIQSNKTSVGMLLAEYIAQENLNKDITYYITIYYITDLSDTNNYEKQYVATIKNGNFDNQNTCFTTTTC